MPSDLKTRAILAAEAYLTRVGYKVAQIPHDIGFPIIAEENDELVLVAVKFHKSLATDATDTTPTQAAKSRWVKTIDTFLTETGIPAANVYPVRVDEVTIHQLAPDKALLRHHRAYSIVE